ncbi:MAG: phosphoribosyltransferase [Micrococcales bacterium 70-64]|nr:phosphoribosyltransferase [Leifsonia sp.]ODU65852.1 MAG: phosphoribosyltransferase [Leifsonia sp. SCN 70-46]OJX84478.1 MAG: phosphoribosyltransferase [Micrococcales bacterium 70-64]
MSANAEAETSREREELSYEQFGEASREIAREVLRSGFEPEIVVAIARGGLLLAGSISYALGIKSCGAVNAEFYTGVGTRLPEPVMLPPLLDEASIAGKRVLLVDDVSDSGRTLAMVVQLLEAGGADLRTAVLYTKPGTVYEPTYSWKRTDRWINFPWSVNPVVTL